MNTRPIRNDQDYRAALKVLSPLFDLRRVIALKLC
jgi:antitoxin component HigA of HigAB toxin-antitoxin module